MHYLTRCTAFIALSGLEVLLVLSGGVVPAGADGCISAPYRPLGSSPVPASASMTYPPASANNFPPSEIYTSETPPQAQVLMTDGTFVSPNSPITVSITPVAPPAAEPGDGVIDGNVYLVSVTTNTGAQLNPVDGAHGVTVLLRGTGSTPGRTMERFDGVSWADLRTLDAGCGNSFEAVSGRLGVFALVVARPNSGGGAPGAPLVVGLVALIVATAVAVIWLNRRPSSK